MSNSIYKVGTCAYCDSAGEVIRPTPFMGDMGLMMCKTCWDNTAEEYAGSEGAYIGKFEEGPGFEEIKPIVDEIENKKKVFDELIENLRTEFEMGCLDATLETITKDGMDISALNSYLEDDISYAAECYE